MSGRSQVASDKVWAGRGILLAAVIALAGLPAAWGQDAKTSKADDRLPSGEKIMEKSIKARGGREAFEKLKSRVSKGTIEMVVGPQTVKGTVISYEAAPDKQHEIREFGPGAKIEIGTDGEVHWVMQADKARIQEGEEKAIAQRQADFYLVLNWRDHYDAAECVGKEQVDDRSCYKVELIPKVGYKEVRYFDRQTGLPIKLETTRKTERGEAAIEVRMDDYREVDGVRLPFKVARKITEGGQTTSLTTIWESIKHNTEIPEEQFALPEAVRKLVDKGKPKPPTPPKK